MQPDATGDMEIERRTLSRVSWRLLPMIGIGYGVAYMDRVNISFASATMNQDLNFSAAIYGLGGGLFFLSYSLFEVDRHAALVRAHHAHLGRTRHRHDVRAHADSVLRDAVSPRRG